MINILYAHNIMKQNILHIVSYSMYTYNIYSHLVSHKIFLLLERGEINS